MAHASIPNWFYGEWACWIIRWTIFGVDAIFFAIFHEINARQANCRDIDACGLITLAKIWVFFLSKNCATRNIVRPSYCEGWVGWKLSGQKQANKHFKNGESFCDPLGDPLAGSQTASQFFLMFFAVFWLATLMLPSILTWKLFLPASFHLKYIYVTVE